ncbi:MAG: Error-prone DNA polymerase [Alphaproteobacteria bacterium ADurb.BinA305]|nr:MAG: Error-prone DNA polymerase [Alphaproteobacteria bacterium ADurb.BinA305]
MRLVAGCRLDLDDGTALLVYPEHRAGWASLCRLLSLGKGRAEKGACSLGWDDVAAWNSGLVAMLVPGVSDAGAAAALDVTRSVFGDRAYCALTIRRRPRDAVRLQGLADRAALAGVPTVATGDVLYHAPDRRLLQDVVTCIREKCTIDDLGDRRERFADRHLKSGEEMARLFRRYMGDDGPVLRSAELASRCSFSLDALRYQYPDEIGTSGRTSQQELERLTWEKAPLRYPEGVSAEVRAQLSHELRLIGSLDYAPYFLTVHSIVAYARSVGILCQGRGSAANSVVCFALGITEVSPEVGTMVFERFVSEARDEPPDIDVDFEHERREEVIQHIYRRFGRHRAGLCATVIHYRGKRAVREVGTAMGLSRDAVAALSSQIWGWGSSSVPATRMAELGFDPTEPRLALTMALVDEIIGFPRHLSQHVGGFVMTEGRLDELVPIEKAAMEDRTVICWDKDDIDTLGILKVDVLALGMLTCLRKGLDLLADHGGPRLTLATIPPEDPVLASYRRRLSSVVLS